MTGIVNPASPVSEAAASEKWLLGGVTLARFHERAPGYDRDSALGLLP